MEEQVTRIINEKTDSISINRGMTGKLGFSVKIYGNITREGDAMLKTVKEYVNKVNTHLNQKVGGE